MPTLLLILAMLFLPSCRITDHTEREVTPDAINFPASGHEKVDPKDLPRIEFKETHVDLGRVVQGAKVEHRYDFRSAGGSALVITDVRGSCGCTVGKDWPKHPMKPGERGSITVAFDSKGRSGRESKTVTVVANTSPPSTTLTFTVEVAGPANVEPVPETPKTNER